MKQFTWSLNRFNTFNSNHSFIYLFKHEVVTGYYMAILVAQSNSPLGIYFSNPVVKRDSEEVRY